jgi:DNA-binding NarL/FixJ family response regulator
MIRVVIVDDHALVREGLNHVLAAERDMEVVGEAANATAAISVCSEQRPDVVLLDLSMPPTDGLAAVRALARAEPPPHIVILTALHDPQRILAALDAGARGCVLKDADPSAVIDAIRSVAAGDRPITPLVAGWITTHPRRPTSLRLSERERGVLQLLAAGRPNKLIAAELGISEKTVKGHLTRIYRELDVTDRTQAALRAHALGLDGGAP